jgi:hypothetical protein
VGGHRLVAFRRAVCWRSFPAAAQEALLAGCGFERVIEPYPFLLFVSFFLAVLYSF